MQPDAARRFFDEKVREKVLRGYRVVYRPVVARAVYRCSECFNEMSEALGVCTDCARRLVLTQLDDVDESRSILRALGPALDED